jgi:selenocysteine-specific elongation factor
MKHLILGTAGHIDHGKTTLVHALTGVHTDRLKEEKARGITIELGFAELPLPEARLGVVDVPGHEAFVRAMVAGAAGMDLVLLVVASDEGVMPQTREHVAIVELLGVRQLVVALTKCDLVDEEWLELVRSDVEDLLESTPYRGALSVPTSAQAGLGMDELKEALAIAAGAVQKSTGGDLVRLPLDRVFTIQGTGTVATGTLWSGTLEKGDRVRILPDDLQARVRGVQVHGREVEKATAGDRTAISLTGEGADRTAVGRGATLVSDPAWSPTWMLTTRVRMLADTAWSLEHNQRVRVHVGTAEIMARCALLEPEAIRAGGAGWVQLRLEEPVVARAHDRLVLRAYSPVSTIGGGLIAEATPPKRNRIDAAVRTGLDSLLDGDARTRVLALLDLAGWHGAEIAKFPITTGLSVDELAPTLREFETRVDPRTGGRLFSERISAQAEDRIVAAVTAAHATDPLRPAISLAAVRTALPAWAATGLADATIARLCNGKTLEAAEGGVRLPGHVVALTPDQEVAASEVRALLAAKGLAPPFVDEFPASLKDRRDLWSLLKFLEGVGLVSTVADGYYVDTSELEKGIAAVRSTLGGQTGLGPSAFRDALPVTRKHLIPLLNHLDGLGVTSRSDEGRAVPPDDGVA